MSQHLSRRDVALVLQRTAELERARAPEGEAISTDDLHKIADELGLSREALSQALAEAKAGLLVPAAERTALDRFYGGATLQARRFVPGTPGAVRETVDLFFRQQGFDVHRRGEDWAVWRRAQGVGGFMRRLGAGAYRLPANVDYRVRVAAVPGGPHPVLVQLEVDARALRAQGVRRGVASLTVGGAGAVTGVMLLPMPVELAAIAGGVALGVAGVMHGRGAFRATREQVHLSLERFLDFLEHEPARIRPASGTARDAFARIADFLGWS